MVQKPLISVITISYNAQEVIEKTINSVLNQSYSNIEYIIIDGCSSDGTVDIIKKYTDKISYWISENDSGVYDAMNKGITAAKGEYINFMNAGDFFFSNDSINDIFKNSCTADVVYGKTEYRFDIGNYIRSPKPIEYIMKGAFCCHQSVFVKTELLKNSGFDTKYKIIADWNLLRNLYINDNTFLFVDVVVASFDNINGISSSPSLKWSIKHLKEKQSILSPQNKYKNTFNVFIYVLTYIIKKIFKMIMPKNIYRNIKLKRILAK